MASNPRFQVTFWGTRGSYPRIHSASYDLERVAQQLEMLRDEGRLSRLLKPGSDILALLTEVNPTGRFGSNTSCFEVRYGRSTYLIDAGTGIKAWSEHSQGRTVNDTYLFITHNHMDHICGLPFVDQLYRAENRISIFGPSTVMANLKQLIGTSAEFHNVLFPISVELMPGVTRFESLDEQPVQIGDVQISTLKLNHPGGAYAYRLDAPGQSIVIATDHEQATIPDRGLAAFAHRVDLLYLDGQYTRLEYDGKRGINQCPPQPRQGWGHSTVDACLHTALAAEVRRLYIGHHDPARTDEQLSQLEREAQQTFRSYEPDDALRPELRFAREGESVDV